MAGGLIERDADGFAAVRTDSHDKLQAWKVVAFAKVGGVQGGGGAAYPGPWTLNAAHRNLA